VTGEAARLDGFDFVRIRTGSDAVSPVFGEKSVEVDAVADVRPDPSWFDVNGDGVVNVDDMYDFGDVASGGDGSADLNGDTVVDAGDYELLEAAVRKDEAKRRSAGRR
jgi:hypothetical protein